MVTGKVTKKLYTCPTSSPAEYSLPILQHYWFWLEYLLHNCSWIATSINRATYALGRSYCIYTDPIDEVRQLDIRIR